MAERKSGPVKPPVIDLTARPAGAEAPKPGADSARAADGARQPAEVAAKPVETSKPGAVRSSRAGRKAAVIGEAKPGPRPAEQAVRPPSLEPVKPAPDTSSAAAHAPASAAVVVARRSPWGAATASGIGGAVIAVAVCYGLAYFGLWPADNSASDARLAILEAGLAESQSASAASTTALADVNTRLSGLETDFAAKLAAASSTLGTMQASVQKLEATSPPAVDLAPLDAQLRTLSARVDAVAAGASSADAGAIAANLATVQQNIADLSQKISALGDRAGATDTAMQDLRAELDSAKGAIDQAAAAPSPKAIASAMQLPLLITALDADFAAGRPYDRDLGNLVAAVPETHVPASVGDAAASGLPAPEELVAAFEAKMPEMIAARPATGDGGWQAQLGDWAKSVLALRQQGETVGDGPDAVLSRLEASVNRHDFSGAVALFAQLPVPMRQAAGDVGAKLATEADAQAFVAGLRQSALAPAGGAQQ